MEFRQLQSLIAITKKGSFAQAAEFLGYTQPTLTTHIQSLEKELNVKLFDRLGHRVRLTREGECFLGYAERILKLTEEAADAVSAEKTPYSKIIIGASETFSVVRLPGLLKEFRQEHPSIHIELNFGDIAKFHDDLKNNVIDIAFIFSGKVPYPDLTAEILCPETMVFIASPEHSLAQQTEIEVSDFAIEDFIVPQAGCAYRAFIDDLLNSNNILPRSFMKVKNIEAIKQFVISGLGLAILPRIYVEKELANNLLIELPWPNPNGGMYTQIIYHKDKWLSPTLENFLQSTRRKFADKN
ncbi:LysR family transcriptional regulator [Sporomusa malonica]|uniref:DNA-binding transcriptional regulator, LysR family n=1 Tax=Sporomusa malonica TaxID=112901 RepID=A0A1W1YFN0_9FIRM|nr:LysR family transcriptional regulator [Sporomusa malonica]SMC34953.1 DNA-binding transcriptional regulator, LysR family [Sporomusa malonica]